MRNVQKVKKKKRVKAFLESELKNNSQRRSNLNNEFKIANLTKKRAVKKQNGE